MTGNGGRPPPLINNGGGGGYGGTVPPIGLINGRFCLKVNGLLRFEKKQIFQRKIGAGSFGDIYLGQNVKTGDEVAVKVEPLKARHPQLEYESRVYRMLTRVF